jgi:lactoylglutathione lyase
LKKCLILSQGVLPTVRFRFYYTGIRVKDLKKSLNFYTKVLGMKVVRKGTMSHGGKYVHLRGSGRGSQQMLELNWYPEGSRFYTEYSNGEDLDHLAFVVEDRNKAFKELVKRGAEVAVGPGESKGTEIYVKDPNGIWLELLS